MIHLYIARHGQTEENVRHILQGQMPGHLTPEGIQQAEELREKLRDMRFDRIFTSDLKRAVDTTRIISEPHGCQFELEPRLRERDFGIHTGGPYIRISHGLDPSAETMEQLAQRAADFLNKIVNLEEGGVMMSQGDEVGNSQAGSVLAVSHGLFLRVLQAVYHGVGIREVEKMDNAEVRLLVLDSSMHFSATAFAETGGTAN